VTYFVLGTILQQVSCTVKHNRFFLLWNLRGQNSNLRPSGYEPEELTPHSIGRISFLSGAVWTPQPIFSKTSPKGEIIFFAWNSPAYFAWSSDLPTSPTKAPYGGLMTEFQIPINQW